MCARLLSCPLCSQPGFATLDALRAGLVSVATRPLACPVCNETLLGIDKLTIHLFGHTINSNDNRLESNKITDANCNNSVRQVSHNGEAILSHNWNSQSAQGISSDRSRPGEIGCNNGFAQLSNMNSAQSVSATVTSKDSNSQGCARALETVEKSQNQIVFVQNSSQQQFCSPRLIKAESSSLPNATGLVTYERTTVPMIFHSSEERTRLLSSKNFPENSVRSSGVVEAAMYRREAMEENLTTRDNNAAKKDDSIAQFSEAWIENLLHENGEKGSGTSVNEGKNHSVSTEELSTLPNGEKKYYSKDIDYRASSSTQTVSSEFIGGKREKLVDSTDSNVRRTEEIKNMNQQLSPNSNEVLPRWKAFRLLAMKDKLERCNICGTHFPDHNFLVLHKQLAHKLSENNVNGTPEEPLKNCPCHLCTKVFKTRGTLMVHMRVAHMGYNLGFLSKDKESCENGFDCPTCGKNFRKEQHVTQHLKTHEGKQWECDVCSKMFTTKYFLKKHKRLHSGEMPYKCTICDKTFTFQQSYHKHRLYHKDDKPHTCATCGRSFKELSTLHNHERIHTGEKPFVCETCGKCFRQRVSYLVHRRIHTGVMPYKCTACGKSFRYKVSQRTHKCQAQPEDPCPPVAESSTGGLLQLKSQLSSEPLTVTENGILLQNQVVSELSPNENNKFILIVNTHGQPILTREADARTNSFLNEKQNTNSQSRIDNHNANQSNENQLWNNHGLSKESTSKECCASSPSQEHTEKEKMQTNETNDFFSLVMSPLENDLSSPSTEMEHLRLESPGNEEIRQNGSHKVCETANTSSLQRDLNHAIDGIFRENCSGNSPLETINEESLKQLLYGMDRKNLE